MFNQRGGVLPILGILILLLLVLSGGYYLGLGHGGSAKDLSLVEDYLLTVNHHTYRSSADKATPYFNFQVQFPARYRATSEEMLVNYQDAEDYLNSLKDPTDQEVGFDGLMLYTALQPLHNFETDTTKIDKFNALFENSDCILISAATGLSSIEDWTNKYVFGYELQLSNEEKRRIGNYDVQKRRVTIPEANQVYDQAFIQFPENVSYFFQTCNTNSEQDLEAVLRSFNVRGAL